MSDFLSMMGRSAQAFMTEQAAAVEPEVELTEEQIEALQAERHARLAEVERIIEEELHPAATPECATAFDSLASFF